MQKRSVQYIDIGADRASQRIDNFLFSQLSRVPKGRIYRMLRKGEVRVNGKRVDALYRLQTGDRLRIPPFWEASAKTSDSFLKLNKYKALEKHIIYEDEDLLVIDKPSGVAVHGGSKVEGGVIEALRAQRGEQAFLELVHRLDQGTSGCLLVAKRHQVLRELHRLMREGKIVKRYHTLVKGRWPKRCDRVDVPLQKSRLRGGERMSVMADEGRAAVTRFKVLEYFAGMTLLEATLETGRTHQIRVHCTYLGHPIAGDDKYGDADFNQLMRRQGLRRLFLHASQLSFLAPGTGRKLDIVAPLDQQLQAVLQQLPKK